MTPTSRRCARWAMWTDMEYPAGAKETSSPSSQPRGWSWPQLLALAAALAVAAVTVVMNPQFQHRPASGPVDMMPLLLGAKAIMAGLDPNDPVVLEGLYRESTDITVRVHGFHNYYPPTASLLMTPLSLLPYKLLVDLFYWGGMLALVGAAWFLARAGSSRGALAGVAGALVVGSVFLQLRLARVALPMGQVSPFVVLAAAIALWGLARGRGRWGLAAFALGGAVKYFPLLLLPAALAGRRWRWLGAAVALAATLVVFMWVWRDGTGGLMPKWIFGATRFVLDEPMMAWAHKGPPWLMWLWRGRVPGLGSLTLALVGVAAWRRAGTTLTTACGGLMLAWGGACMAGGHHYHESIMILPALGFVLTWPAVRGPRLLQWLSAATMLAALFVFNAYSRHVPVNPPHWLPLSYITWLLCAVRWVWAYRWERIQAGRSS